MPEPRILITHSNRQHSHQLAQALHERTWLVGYWAGVPSRSPEEATAIDRLVARFSDNDPLPIPGARIRQCYVEPIVNNLIRRVLPPERAVYWAHQAGYWFDAWAARTLRRTRPQANAVIGYENAALRTFVEARRQGLVTILDAASFHHAGQDRFYDYIEPEAVHAAITRHKDRELALAEHIFTVSEFARESYLAAGVAPDRVTAVPVGCDLQRFEPSAPGNSSAGSGRPTFIYVGHVSERKGIDLLLQASRQLQATCPHRLQVVGGGGRGIDWKAYPWVEVTGRVHQAEVAERMQAADCFVLPSRHDSFGMVVVEAMASGLPVVVSNHVGAKEAVTPGRSGWILPAEDVEALRERMAWCATHPHEVAAMRDHAVADARRYSWAAYRSRVTEAVDEVVSRHISPSRVYPAELWTPRGEGGEVDAVLRAATPGAPERSEGRVERLPRPLRVTLFTTHPIQTQVPWFRALHQHPDVALTVYYEHIPEPAEQGRGFDVPFTWDIPLLEGYDWQVRPERLSSTWQYLPVLRSTLQKHTPDVAIVAGWQHPFLRAATLQARWHGVPVLGRGDSNALKPRSPLIQLLHRFYLQLFDGFLVVGKANERFYKMHGVSRRRLYAAPASVDNARFAQACRALTPRQDTLREEYRVPPEAFCVLFAGKFIEKKRPLDVLRAVALAQHTSSRPLHALMVGDGRLLASARELADQQAIPATFTGFLNQTEISEAYTMADVLVLPSDYDETWGLVVNEAMVCGTPAILSDRVGSAEDLIIPGVTGYTVPFADVEALARRVQQLAAHPTQHARMAEAAREHIQRGYSIEVTTEGTLHALHALQKQRATATR